MSRKHTPLNRKLISPADALMAIGAGFICALIAWGILYALTDSYWLGIAAGFPAGLVACVAVFAQAPGVS